MGFTIDRGSPGVLTALLVLFGAAALAIAVYFLFSVLRGAREEIAGEDEPDAGSD